MPYTRNTRIKVVHKKHEDIYTAQVEYRIPFTKISWWVDFKEIGLSFIDYFTDGCSAPYKAQINCFFSEDISSLRGLDWAKAIIDEYHKLMDEKEHKDIVEYIKYPQEE